MGMRGVYTRSEFQTINGVYFETHNACYFTPWISRGYPWCEIAPKFLHFINVRKAVFAQCTFETYHHTFHKDVELNVTYEWCGAKFSTYIPIKNYRIIPYVFIKLRDAKIRHLNSHKYALKNGGSLK